MSNSGGIMTKRRTKKDAEKDRSTIIALLAEEGGGKSQNQINIALKEINWATLRRDLKQLQNDGFLTVEKGIRGAICHFLSFKGLLYYLSTTEIVNPLRIRLIHENHDALESTRARLLAGITKQRDHLKKLVKIIEREGKRLDFPIFSEIQTLFEYFIPETIKAIILNSSKLVRIETKSVKFSHDIKFLKTIIDDEKQSINYIEKYPFLGKVQTYQIKNGERIKTGIINREKIVRAQIKTLEETLPAMIKSQETILKQSFIEFFLKQLHPLLHNDIQIKNEPLYSMIEHFLRGKEEELRIVKVVSQKFVK